MRSVGVITVAAATLAAFRLSASHRSDVSDYLRSMHPGCNVGVSFGGAHFSSMRGDICHVDSAYSTVGFSLKPGTEVPFELRLKDNDGTYKPYTVSGIHTPRNLALTLVLPHRQRRANLGKRLQTWSRY